MKLLNCILCLLLFIFSLSGQTVLYDDPAGQSYTNTDGPVLDVTPTVDISNCTSIEFRLDYEFPAGWEGGGNMEYLGECCTSCSGDPTNPTEPGCLQSLTCTGMFGCWDLMWIQAFVDGSPEDELLIGDANTTNAFNMGTYSFIFCVDDEEEAHFEITNQNWASSETNIFTNVSILCWEARPSIEELDPVCGAQQVDLIGEATDESVVVSWFWTTDGNADIDNDASQVTFATNVSDGEEFTLTTTDINNCQGTETVEASVASFDVVLMGGGSLCVGDCSDDDSDFIVDISGGVPLYELSLTVNGIPVPFLPLTDVDAIFRVCSDPDIAFPDYDDSTDPPQVIIPSNFFPISIDLINIEDANGCTGNIMGGAVNYDLFEPPAANSAVSPEYCVDETEFVDLTLMDDQIDPNGFTVLWFEDDELEDQIINPEQYDISNGDFVYAVVDDGQCFSEVIEVLLDIYLLPIIEVTQSPLVDCSNGVYTLPDIEDIADIENATDPGYYLEADGQNGPVSSIDPEDVDEIYIYDSSAPGCFAEVILTLQIGEAPDIESPLELSGCGSIELPTPEGSNIDFFEYNLSENGTGDVYRAGDIINESDNIDVIYLIAQSIEGCETIIELDIFLESSIDFMVNIDSLICADSLILPAILPNTGSVGYFTASQGNGMVLMPGDVIFAPFDGELYVFDPNLNSGCASEDTLRIQLTTGPAPVFPSDTSACEFIVLPEFGGITGPNIRYAQFPVTDPRSSYYPGDTLDFAQRLYILDTIGTCIYFDSMQVNIITEPDVGIDTNLIICEGFTSSPFDLMELLSDPDIGGQWNYPSSPGFNPIDSTSIMLTNLILGSYSFSYTIEDSICGLYSSMLRVDVIERPYGGENNNLSLCAANETLNFMSLISDPETGGEWSQVSGPQAVSLTDSTVVDMSSVATGNYGFLYVIEGEAVTEYCEPESASLFINIGEGPDAGDDVSSTACQGEIIDLIELIDPSADTNGFFEGDNIIFNGTEWNTSVSPADMSYTINYIVESSDVNCPSDTAIILIDLFEQFSAGQIIDDVLACEGDTIDLNNFITGSTGQGNFFSVNNPGVELIGGIWIANQTEDIMYIVEGISGCPSDTLVFTAESIEEPSFNLSVLGSQICTGNPLSTIELNIVPLNSNSNLYTVNIYDANTNMLVLSVDILSHNNMTILLSANSMVNGFSNDTIYIAEGEGNYRLELNAFDGTRTCQDNLDVSTNFEIIDAYREDIDVILCPGEAFEYSGAFYTNSQTLNFPGGIAGCDSIININISNFTEASSTLNGSFCQGDSVEVFGQYFLRDTQSVEVLTGGSSEGCDTTVFVNLQFVSSIETNISPELCPGESLIINSVLYNESNSTGIDTVQSVQGCDSILIISLNYKSIPESDFNTQICPGAVVMVGNDVYDENTLSGTSILMGAASNGCDSIVNVLIELSSVSEMNLSQDICPGEFIMVGPDQYDETNLSGSTLLPGQANTGCDSLVNVQLNLLNDAVLLIEQDLCRGETLVFGNDSYDENTLSGTSILTGGAQNGCDSIIEVNLNLIDESVFDLSTNICPDEIVTVGSDVYDASNPCGTSILENASVSGCDSIVNVSLSLLPVAETLINDQLCAGEFVQVGSDIYNVSNPAGTTILTGSSSTGCDSIVEVNLEFFPPVFSNLNIELCPGNSIQIGNDIYDENNPSGSSVLSSSTINGCDSTISVEIQFLLPEAEIDFNLPCPGDNETQVEISELHSINTPVEVFLNSELMGSFDEEPITFAVGLGVYDVMIIDDNSCSYEESILVETVADDDLVIIPEFLGDNTYNIRFQSNATVDEITWESTAFLSCSDCNETSVQISENTSVQLSITTAEGCILTRSVMLEYTELILSDFYIPNIIDLNDPENNAFRVFSQNGDATLEMSIYDRWGNLVYFNQNTTGEDIRWDGRRNDRELEQGVYVYKLILRNTDNSEETRIGSLTLIR